VAKPRKTSSETSSRGSGGKVAGVDPHWIRGPADELAVAQGCTFDRAAGGYVIEFIEGFCRQSKGEWAGRPLKLLDWQTDFILRLYGWRRPDGTRRYRTFYVEVAKKNGKSTLVSGLVLYHLIADGEPGAEVYVGAYDRSQASIIFDEAARMIGASPALSKILDVVASAKRIVHPASHSKALALSADVPSKDGVSASFTVFDELHRQRTSALWDIFRYAGAARRQPLMGAITTAGVDRQSICYRQRDYSQKVNAGLIEDISHLGVIYAADPADPIDSPETWAKANPSLGVTIKPDDFAREVQEALESPTQLNNFLRLRLDIWTNAVERFLPADRWDACGLGPVDPEELKGRECYAGLDLASTIDIAALALVFRMDDGTLKVLMFFWVPGDNAERREEKDRVPYVTWARQGLVKMTEGAAIDYDAIRSDITALDAIYPIRKLLADPWNATQLLTQLGEQDGIEVETIRQGFASLSAPTKELERLVISGEIHHGDNPVLNWMCSNAMAARDASGNVKLDKGKSTEKIDGLAALINGIAARLSDPDAGASSDPGEITFFDFD
jgi:phage terminase large subunit-like protein